MQFSKAHLDELVSNDIAPEDLAHQLSMSGLEVDGISPVAGDFSGIVVGKIVGAEQHPDADKLKVCQVDVGEEAPLQIVCGGKNAREGIMVAVAMVGAVLPGDFKIKKAKLRGVESLGMLCSTTEMGLSESADGIMELPEDAPMGKDIREYLQLDDVSIEVDLTANRGDCLSVLGMAREVATINNLKLKTPEIQQVSALSDEERVVVLDEQSCCPLYCGRVITGVNACAETPLWMSERLRRAGIKVICPVVDITNYVMITMGAPMHAFDNDKLSGDIHVRRAKDGEKITLLDEATHDLNNALVIADENGPVALAGIMGDLATSVTGDTKNVFLECAHFSPDGIRGKARRFGLNTDASARFERGVDPSLPPIAIEMATALIIEICGGTAGKLVVTGEAPVYHKGPVNLDVNRYQQLIGAPVEAAEAKRILEQLGFEVTVNGDRLSAQPPKWRFDIRIEEDLIEEIARIQGFDQLGESMPKIPPITKHITSPNKSVLSVKSQLASRGFNEAICYSFINPKHHEAMFPGVAAQVLENPISFDLSVMRVSLVPGLLASIKHNISRQMDRVRLFEIGHVFLDANEVNRVAAVASGPRLSLNPCDNRQVDFFDVKADVESLFNAPVRFEPIEEGYEFLHPGQRAALNVNGQLVGWMGQLHPLTLKAFGVKQKVFAFEVDMDAVQSLTTPQCQAFSKFPSIKRDIAILIDKKITADQVVDEIRESAGAQLVRVECFDHYEGENIDESKKSLAFNLILQDLSHTLNEDDVTRIMDTVISRLTSSLNAQLRE